MPPGQLRTPWEYNYSGYACVALWLLESKYQMAGWHLSGTGGEEVILVLSLLFSIKNNNSSFKTQANDWVTFVLLYPAPNLHSERGSGGRVETQLETQVPFVSHFTYCWDTLKMLKEAYGISPGEGWGASGVSSVGDKKKKCLEDCCREGSFHLAKWAAQCRWKAACWRQHAVMPWAPTAGTALHSPSYCISWTPCFTGTQLVGGLVSREEIWNKLFLKGQIRKDGNCCFFIPKTSQAITQ